jgi:thiamine biosynthesis lipoprotein
VIGMPLVETLPVDDRTAQWPVWGTTARVVVTEPDRLAEARRLVTGYLGAVDRACSRFRDDSEVQQVHRAGGRPVYVSAMLADLVATALAAARRTSGRVDPTVGAAMVRLGYDRDLLSLSATGGRWQLHPQAAPGWQRVKLVGRELTVPAGVLLDLGATGKAYAADKCAQLVARRCATGVLVSLGGDLATAGPAPEGGWRVLVQDQPGEPRCTIALPAGAALATSSTLSRRWRTGGQMLHHILDPRTCLPARPVWRTVSVAAPGCVEANTLTTAAIVRGASAADWLRSLGRPARLVDADQRVLTLAGWPDPDGGTS